MADKSTVWNEAVTECLKALDRAIEAGASDPMLTAADVLASARAAVAAVATN